jgi:uncharacterized coiled-coil protein SlyX
MSDEELVKRLRGERLEVLNRNAWQAQRIAHLEAALEAKSDVLAALQARLAEVEAELRFHVDDAVKAWSAHEAAETRADAAEARVKELEAQPAVQPLVKVKPLVWVDNPDLGGGGFLGGSDANIGPLYHAMQDGWSLHRGMFWRKAESLDAAKAAAQADYAARILAALDVQPAPEVAALVEALRRARDWIHAGGDRPGPILRQIDAALAAMEGRG